MQLLLEHPALLDDESFLDYRDDQQIILLTYAGRAVDLTIDGNALHYDVLALQFLGQLLDVRTDRTSDAYDIACDELLADASTFFNDRYASLAAVIWHSSLLDMTNANLASVFLERPRFVLHLACESPLERSHAFDQAMTLAQPRVIGAFIADTHVSAASRRGPFRVLRAVVRN
jgi:hypothetical protein